MQAFIRGHAFFIGTAMSFLLLSILCRFMTWVLLKKLLKEAENMSATENKLLKQCKLKFQNCYELNGGSVNVEVFVGKFMQNIRLCKCSLRMMGQLSGQLLLLSVFAEGIGACIGIAHGETLGNVLPYYLLAFLSLYLYFSISGLIDVQGKQDALKMSVMDFLENRMSGRIESVKRDSEYLDEVEAAARAKKMPEEEKKRGMLLRERNDAAKQRPSERGHAMKNDRTAAGGAERMETDGADRLAAGGVSEKATGGADRTAAGGAERMETDGADRLEAGGISEKAAGEADRAATGGADRTAAGGVSGTAAYGADRAAGIRENGGCEAEKMAEADAKAEKEELEALLGEFLA